MEGPPGVRSNVSSLEVKGYVSTGNKGTVTDATGEVVPVAKIVVHNLATGEERSGKLTRSTP